MTAVLALGLFWLLTSVTFRPPMPSHGGKSLAQWLDPLVATPEAAAKAEEAIRAMGSSSVPYLVWELRRTESLGRALLIRIDKRVDWVDLKLPSAPTRRIRALAGLKVLGTNAQPALPELVAAFVECHETPERDSVNPHFLRVFVTIGPQSIDALSPLLRQTENPEIAANVVRTLKGIVFADGAASSAHFKRLIDSAEVCLERGGSMTAIGASCLGGYGKLADAAVPSLLSCLSAGVETPAEEATAVIRALGDIRTRSDTVVPALAQMLNHRHHEVRREAIVAIGSYGARGELAVPALARLIEMDSVRFECPRRELTTTLGQIGPASAVCAPFLVEGLTHPVRYVRSETARAIARIQPNPEWVLPGLMECLDDSSYDVRRAAVRAIGTFGPAAEPAVQGVIPLLTHSDESLQIAAIDALMNIGPAAAPAIPHLERAARNNQSGLGRYVTQALVQIDEK